MTASFEWRLIDILHDAESQRPNNIEFALIVLNQPLRAGRLFESLWRNVAADGGANRLYDLLQSTQYHLQDQDVGLDAIVGDLDSLRLPVKQYFTSLDKPARVICEPDQNFYDLDKALSWVRSNYAANMDVAILGDLGGRVDHGLRQIHYLYVFQPGPAYADGRIFLITSQNLSILLKPGHHQILVQGHDGGIIGKSVGVIPVGKPSFITTKGLHQDVKQLKIVLGERIIRDNVLPGMSTIEIETSDDVLFTIDVLDI